MERQLSGPVPEIPVSQIDGAAEYYRDRLGFTIDWGDEAGGIAGVSRGECRLFLTNAALRAGNGNGAPVVVRLNLADREQADALHEDWNKRNARIVAPPEAKRWKLYEFTALDLDGNRFRLFYDFAWEEG